jgi:hypothetical protein
MTSLLKNLVIITFLVAALAVGYYLFIQNNQGSLTAAPGGARDGGAAINAQLQLRQLQELQQIEISGDLFADERFRSLQSFREPVRPAAAGRSTPFLSADGQTASGL